MRIFYDAEFLGPLTAGTKYVVGWGSSNHKETMFLGVVGNVDTCHFSVSDCWADYTHEATSSGRHQWDVSANDKCYVDGTCVGSGTYRTTSGVADSSRTMYLAGACHVQWGTSSYSHSSKVYACRIWDDGTPVFDVVPASVGGSVGFYDRVKHKLFTNAGSGSYTQSANTSVAYDAFAGSTKLYFGTKIPFDLVAYQGRYDRKPHSAAATTDVAGVTFWWSKSSVNPDFSLTAPPKYTKVGAYTNVVKAIDLDGNEEIRAVTVVIEPAWISTLVGVTEFKRTAAKEAKVTFVNNGSAAATVGAVWGDTDLGGKIMLWEHTATVGEVAVGQETKVVWTLPDGFPKQDFVIRFFIDDPEKSMRRLESISTTGSQFLDTGLYPKTTTRLVYDVAFTDTSAANSGIGWGSSAGKDLFAVGVRSDKQLYLCAAGSWVQTPTIVNDGARHLYDVSANGQLLFDGTSYGTGTYSKTCSVADSSRSLCIAGAMHVEWITAKQLSGAYLDQFHSSAVYGCQIYDGDTKLRHYLPAKNGATVGLYEVLSGVLYPSWSSTAFVAGADIGSFYDAAVSLSSAIDGSVVIPGVVVIYR